MPTWAERNYRWDAIILIRGLGTATKSRPNRRQDGHNFVGHCNYYAMPLALYKKVKDEIPDGIGVLLYYNGENTCGIRKKIECKPRQLSEKTQKWLIMSVAKRLTKMSKA